MVGITRRLRKDGLMTVNIVYESSNNL